jgi:hypothetical protein
MLLLLFPTLPTGARMVNAINGRTQLGCQCFLVEQVFRSAPQLRAISPIGRPLRRAPVAKKRGPYLSREAPAGIGGAVAPG